MRIVIYDNRDTRYAIRDIITVLLSYAYTLFFIFPLNAQNPYEYAQEELFLTSFGIRERYESDDCATARTFISRFHNADAKGDEDEKLNTMRAISFFQCGESYTFFENRIKNGQFDTERCQAIMFLSWMQNPEYLPTILEYAKNRKLTIQEKAAIATAYMVFGVYGATPNLKEQSIAILDEICYDAPVDVLATCIINYFNLKGSAAIHFFNAQLEKEEFKIYAAFFLVLLGEHQQTFPIFLSALNSEDEYEVHTAILGLAEIGTEEALQLITTLPLEKNRLTQRKPLIDFNLNEIKKL
jgi:HEAT repeat protein